MKERCIWNQVRFGIWRCGGHQVEHTSAGFVVSCLTAGNQWRDIDTAATREGAFVLAEAHMKNPPPKTRQEGGAP